MMHSFSSSSDSHSVSTGKGQSYLAGMAHAGWAGGKPMLYSSGNVYKG